MYRFLSEYDGWGKITAGKGGSSKKRWGEGIDFGFLLRAGVIFLKFVIMSCSITWNLGVRCPPQASPKQQGFFRGIWKIGELERKGEIVSDASCHSGERQLWRDGGPWHVPEQQRRVRGSAACGCRGDTRDVSPVLRLSQPVSFETTKPQPWPA